VVHVKVRCLAVLVGLVHIDGIVSFAREAMLTKSGAEQISKTRTIRFQGILSVV
jgi:hypothetical protein